MDCPSEIKHIVHRLSNLQGITRYYVLSKEDCRFVSKNEEKTNLGVLEAVKRSYIVCLVHDSSWRDPTQPIVKREDGKVIFPPVVFPEVAANNIVSSSPGVAVHNFLCKKIRVGGDEATLLIGFDL
jgi:hypothetical protein